MITIDEIKSLPAREKWLIFSALQDDADVLGELSNINRVNNIEEESDLLSAIDEEKILKYIQIVDDRLSNGTAQVLTMEEVLQRLKAKRNAI